MLNKFHAVQEHLKQLRSEMEAKLTIEKLLEKVCSENPLDPEKTKHWMQASIKLVDPKSICRVKPMKYSPQDVEEFAKQIKELLEMKIIIPSKSQHMSPVFLVENEAERKRGKKRMVVNYKKMNDLTVGDGHNLQSDLDSIIKPLLKEIKILLEKLSNQENSSTSEIVEANAAKIIAEMKNCPCNKEILDALGSQPKDTEKTVIPKTDNEERYFF